MFVRGKLLIEYFKKCLKSMNCFTILYVLLLFMFDTFSNIFNFIINTSFMLICKNPFMSFTTLKEKEAR